MAGRTVRNGYDARHKAKREALRPRVEAGEVDCARADCLFADRPAGRRILPGEPWDLGHDDFDKSRYQGPEHRACNRRAGLLKGLGKLRKGSGRTESVW